MKPILVFALVLITTHARSNSTVDSIPQRPDLIQSTYEPIFRITEEDITRLPFTDIIEVINGRFPFVFADRPSSSEYTFLVDGHLILNINSINITQIALIEYYPVSFDPGGGSLSLKGTFVITTKARRGGGSGLNIRSQGGLAMSNEKAYFNPTQFKLKFSDEFFTHQEVGYDHAGKKLQLSVGGSLTSSPDPSYERTDDAASMKLSSNNQWRRVRVSLLGGYQVTAKLRLSLALLGTWLQDDFDAKTEQTGAGGLSTYNNQEDLPYYGAAIGVEFKPSSYFNNTLRIEYSKLKQENNYDEYSYGQIPNVHSAYFYQRKTSDLAVINTSNGTFNKSQQVELGWQLTIKYHDWNEDLYYRSVAERPPGVIFLFNDGSSSKGQHTLAVMPGLSINVNRRFNAQVGVTYDSELSGVHPYAGIRWHAPFRTGSKVPAFVIHSTIEKEPHINYTNNLLEKNPRPGSDPINGVAPAFRESKYGYTWVSGINTGNDRFRAALNILLGELYSPVDLSGIGTVKVKRSGVSLDLQATLASRENFSCKLRTLFFYERYKPAQTGSYSNHPMMNDDLSPQVRGSVSLDMAAGNFFLQVQGLVRFRDEGFNQPTAAERKPVANHGLTFLVAGYRFHIEKLSNLQCDLSLQTRNLALMKEPRAVNYYGSRYVGLGVNVKI